MIVAAPSTRHERTRLLVVGNGMATDRLLDELVARGATDVMDVTVVGEEPMGAYNRVLLSHVLGGLDPDDVVTKPHDWYAEAGVELVAGRWVQRLDTEGNLAHIGNGETLPYDVAVLAAGSTAVLPRIGGAAQPDGTRTTGVHVFRSMEDCLMLRAELVEARSACDVVVVGGGLLGLEAAKTIADLGHRVVIVHPFDHLLETQLDETGGRLLRTRIEHLGITVAIGRAATVLARPGSDGRVRAEALLLEDGRALEASVVVFCVGVRPRTEVAAASGIEVDRGIVVDDCLATSAPDVFAIGECAQLGTTTFGLVAPCWDQAAVLADLLTEVNPGARYVPAPLYVRLKVAGVDVTSLGALAVENGDEAIEVLERSRGIYRRLLVRDGRLAGALIVGDPMAAPTLIGLLERGDVLPENRLDVFCSTDAFRRSSPADDILCYCNRVNQETVATAAAAGAGSLEEIGRATRAGTGCGSCAEAIEAVLTARAVAAV